MTGIPPGASQRVCFIGNHVPRKCGIATFTTDLSNAVRPLVDAADVVAINEPGALHEYPPHVVYQVPERRTSSYREAADYLNLNGYSVACLQHEFGIFGGPAGSHVLHLLRNLRMPLTTTLHTVIEELGPEQREVLQEIVQLSQRVIVMSKKAKSLLESAMHVDPRRIELIPHGAPNVELVPTETMKSVIGAQGRTVLLTFGLLSPDKGIEYVIEALPELVKSKPDLLYIVLGATHPTVRSQTNDSYRKRLVRLAKDRGVEGNVLFIDKFVELDTLLQYLQAADVYVTPYLKEQQVTSGTLSYAYSCGKPIVSTPYWHAAELLADGRGELVGFRDSGAIEKSIAGLLSDPDRLHGLAKRAHADSRELTWDKIGARYVSCFNQTIVESRAQLWNIAYTQPESKVAFEMPSIDTRHIEAMTDDTGIFQHAIGPIPNRLEGYCVDDNARALLVCARLAKLGSASPTTDRLINTYLSFIHHAWNPEESRFRNFMSFDRRWLESVGSEDCHGRVIWGLGEFVSGNSAPELRKIALSILDNSIESVRSFTSPRAWAYAILGMTQEGSPMSGDSAARDLCRELGDRLVTLYRMNASDDWKWFEQYVAYDNARISQAMLCAGRALDIIEYTEIGLESLRWLFHEQMGDQDEFFPVGCESVWFNGQQKPKFDHQPLEAWAMVDACLDAATILNSSIWAGRARLAVDWFIGRNHLRQSVADPRTGGCRDGIHEDRLNENQGAESTLAFVGSCARYLEYADRANWRHGELRSQQ
jgi:glycosyltransferase involved in cell wall biosynthesis